MLSRIRPLLILFLKRAYFTIISCIDFAVYKFVSARERKIGTVLFVRSDSLGDFILWLESAKELRKLYPSNQYKITLLANEAWVELAREFPYWDEICALNPNRFFYNPIYRLKFLTKIRRKGFDIVVNPLFSRDYDSDILVYISGAAQRIGSQGDISNITVALKKRTDLFYTTLTPALKAPLWEVERNAEFLCGLGCSFLKKDILTLEISSSRDLYLESSDYYVLCPGAGWSQKQWPTDRFAQVAHKIYQKTKLTGIICGSSADRRLSKKLINGRGSILKDYVGHTSLQQLLEIIRHAKFLLANDSGVVHLAAALSVPAVCILGGGHFGRFLPYPVETKEKRTSPGAVFHPMDCFHCQWRCIYPVGKGQPFPCVAAVSVDQVWEKIDKLLS